MSAAIRSPIWINAGFAALVSHLSGLGCLITLAADDESIGLESARALILAPGLTCLTALETLSLAQFRKPWPGCEAVCAIARASKALPSLKELTLCALSCEVALPAVRAIVRDDSQLEVNMWHDARWPNDDS